MWDKVRLVDGGVTKLIADQRKTAPALDEIKGEYPWLSDIGESSGTYC